MTSIEKLRRDLQEIETDPVPPPHLRPARELRRIRAEAALQIAVADRDLRRRRAAVEWFGEWLRRGRGPMVLRYIHHEAFDRECPAHDVQVGVPRPHTSDPEVECVEIRAVWAQCVNAAARIVQ